MEAQREAQRGNPDLPTISISSCQKMTATFLDSDHSASSQFYIWAKASLENLRFYRLIKIQIESCKWSFKTPLTGELPSTALASPLQECWRKPLAGKSHSISIGKFRKQNRKNFEPLSHLWFQWPNSRLSKILDYRTTAKSELPKPNTAQKKKEPDP